MNNLSKYQKADIVAEVLLQSYLQTNKARMRDWISDRYDHDNDPPRFEVFMKEFPYNKGYDDPSLCEMMNEQLDHFRLAGYNVTHKVVSELEYVFESLLDEVMQERAEKKAEAHEYQREYREVAGW